jgi:HD-GYP domain-containing protein (c-di-GMP phosphodiesterase class II)
VTPAELRVKELQEQLRHMEGAIVCALNQVLDLRDLDTGCHSTRLAEWAVRVAVDMGLDEGYQRNLEVACALHDIGKIAIPDAILRKPGPLTDDERQVMRKHPEYGWAILRLFPGLELASLFALHHHERFDGSGYPGGLRGEEIPLGARIVAIVDTFDAMVFDRCYRRGLPLEEARQRLTAAAGSHLDPDLVNRFVAYAWDDLVQLASASAAMLTPVSSAG